MGIFNFYNKSLYVKLVLQSITILHGCFSSCCFFFSSPPLRTHFTMIGQSLLAFKKLITSDPHHSMADWSPTSPCATGLPLPAAAVIQTEWSPSTSLPWICAAPFLLLSAICRFSAHSIFQTMRSTVISHLNWDASFV
jgi:hypothetical protein